MSELRDQLLELFRDKNPKSYGRIVSTRPQLLQQINVILTRMQTQNISETLWCIIHDQTPPLCACGNPKKFNTFILGYRNFCGCKTGKCSAAKKNQSTKMSAFWQENPDVKQQMIQKKEQTTLTMYGVTHAVQSEKVMQRVKDTNVKKYGVEFPFQSQEIRDKSKETLKQNHGVEYAFQNEQIRKKAEDKFIENNPGLTDKMQLARDAFIQEHGVNPFALPTIKNKILNDRLEKYGYKHSLQKHLSLEIVNILEDSTLFLSAITGLTIGEASVKLGVNETTIVRRAVQYGYRDILVKSCRSKWEYKMTQTLLSLGLIENIHFIRGDRTVLNGKELDFYFPAIMAAVEIGSVFYHSEVSAGRGEKYHYDKWSKCREQGIDLYQYWDYEMESKWAVIESKIRYLFSKIRNRVGARQITKIQKISLDQERDFLEINHIQGFGQDRSLAMGAYVGDKLVAVMAFGFHENDIEISRYATDITTNYPGLFDKMLKFSLTQIGDHAGKRLVSYSDNRHSNGNVYRRLGFTCEKSTSAEYYYTRDYHSVDRKRKFTRDKIQKKFGIDITGKTEWQLMQELGYDRVWDAGKKFWVKQS